VGNYGKDFLGKARRELLGLKLNDADAARTTFKEHERGRLSRSVRARGRRRWESRGGRVRGSPRRRVEGEVRQAHQGSTGLDRGREEGARPPRGARADPPLRRRARGLAPHARCPPAHRARLVGRAADAHPLHRARYLAVLASWLFHQRPVGCPIRAGIPAVVAKMRAVADDPQTIWKLAELFYDSDNRRTSRTRRRCSSSSVASRSISRRRTWSSITRSPTTA